MWWVLVSMSAIRGVDIGALELNIDSKLQNVNSSAVLAAAMAKERTPPTLMVTGSQHFS